MVNRPSEIKGQKTRLHGDKNDVQSSSKANHPEHRQQPPCQPKPQNGADSCQLLDAFKRINRLLRSSYDLEAIRDHYLELCLDTFSCDQAWLLPAPDDDGEPWRLSSFYQRNGFRPKKPAPEFFPPQLGDFFRVTGPRKTPIYLNADHQLTELFGCQSILLTVVNPTIGMPCLFGLNQGSPRIWRQDEIELFREFGQLLGDGLSQRLKSQQHSNNEDLLRSKLQNTIDAMPSALIGIDKKKQIRQWNQAATKLFHIPTQNALGQDLSQLLPDLPLPTVWLQQTLSSHTIIHQHRLKSKLNDQIKQLEISIYPITEQPPAEAVIRIDDVTDRARMEEHFIQHEKMLSVGNLAAGIAHEINNPLAGILQNVQVVKNRLSPVLPKNAQQAEACGTRIELLHRYMHKRGVLNILDSIMTSAIRAADIVQNMLDFSRKNEDCFQLHDLRILLDKTVDLAASNFNLQNQYDFRKFDIIRNYAPDLPQIYCNPAQIQQVFLNILKNGAHAMTHQLHQWEKNRTTLSPQEKPHFTLSLDHKKNSIICEIKDTGCGMREEVRNRIFEPFYTTKNIGEGTGLGMSICYFIVTKNHNGRMSVESMPGLGSRFIIELPLQTPPSDKPLK